MALSILQKMMTGQLPVYIVGTIILAVFVNCAMKILQLFARRRKDQVGLKDFAGPAPHWLFGNLKETRDGKILDLQVQWGKMFHGAFIFAVGPFIHLLRLNMPDDMRLVISSKGGSEPKDPVMYSFIKPWIGDGLLVSEGKKWHRNRRLLTPAFHFDILKPYVRIFSDSSAIMMNKWCELIKKDNSVDMFEHVSLHTLDSILKCAFGYESNCQQEGKRNPYIQCVYEISELVTKRFRFFPYHNDFIYALSPQGFRSRRAISYAHSFTKGVINKRRDVLKTKDKAAEKRKYLDFLDILLETKDEDGNGLTDQEIQDEVDTFMFEGHDTTASGISWCLYNLARHPEYQQRVREEVLDVLAGRDYFTWEDMSKLEYLTMCVKESLRLHPPVPNVSRRTTRPIAFPDGRQAPADTWVGIGIYAVHHNPDVWNDPETYDPERFTANNSRNRSPHAFIPFSAGPRNCIGQNFAMSEMKTCVGNVLRNFKLEVDDTKPVTRIPELILRSKGGLWLKLTALNSA